MTEGDNVEKIPLLKLVSLLLLTVLLFSLAACAANDGVPKKAKQVFEDYLKAATSDMALAASYCNLTDQEKSAWAEVPPELSGYEIHDWVKLSDRLWVVSASLKMTEGTTTEHDSFVILLDGTYKVCPSVDNIPQDIQAGVDLSPYTPTSKLYLGEQK